jgi:glycosyltransferase involved in cell wall biosynthesis
MRVLCIATAYPRHEGDHVTPWLPELIRRLRACDVEVEVLTSAYRGLGDQTVAGVRVHRFRYAPASLEHLTHDRSAPAQLRRTPALGAVVPAYIARGRAAAERLALTGRFDLVHVLWPVPHAILGAAAKRAGRLPLVSTFFGSELAWRGVLRTALAPAARSAVRVSDRVTAISRYTADLLRRLVPDAEARVIPIGAAVEPPPLDSSAGTGGGPSLELLYVGRLTRRKGVHVLLDALATTPAGTVLHVLGEGPERAALEIRAAKLGLAARVRLHGFVPRDQLARRYRECDALVLPSLAGAQGDVEGLGIPAIEALSFGKPVIASRVGGIGEIVEDGATGILVPPGDAEAIARAIAAIDGDRSMGRRLGERGREHVQRTFAWTPILDALVDEYDRAGRRSAAS